MCPRSYTRPRPMCHTSIPPVRASPRFTVQVAVSGEARRKLALLARSSSATVPPVAASQTLCSARTESSTTLASIQASLPCLTTSNTSSHSFIFSRCTKTSNCLGCQAGRGPNNRWSMYRLVLSINFPVQAPRRVCFTPYLLDWPVPQISRQLASPGCVKSSSEMRS